MGISIDLKLMREIVFKDDSLLKEMLGEWIEDSDKKIAEIKERITADNKTGVFNKIHELKTNFSMIHCYTGIQCCEHLLELIEKENRIEESGINELNQIVQSVNSQIQIIIQSNCISK
jgi:HPt (histidine-containing phosphotransfer) domain-containing protein